MLKTKKNIGKSILAQSKSVRSYLYKMDAAQLAQA